MRREDRKMARLPLQGLGQFVGLCAGSLALSGGATLQGGFANAAELTPPPLVPVEPPAVSRLLPNNTAFALFMNPDEKLWQSLTQFQSFPRDMTTPGWLFSGAFQGINYHGDIQPWLGGLSAGVMLVEPETGESRYATVLPVKDAAQMPKFLDRLKRHRSNKLPVTRSHNGVSILYWEPERFPAFDPPSEENVEQLEAVKSKTEKSQPSDSQPSDRPVADPAETLPKIPESAVSGDITAPSRKKMIEFGGFAAAYLPSGFVVVSEKLETVQYLIDRQPINHQPLPDALVHSPAFQRTLQDSRYPKSLLTGFGDYSLLLKSSLADVRNLANPFFSIDPNSPELKLGFNLIDQYQDRVDAFLWMQPEGLEAQASIHLKKSLPTSLTTMFTSPNRLATQMPAVTYGMSDGNNLASFWNLLMLGLNANPKTKKLVADFRSASQKNVGIDDRDIFPWMDREYAIYGFPTRGGLFPKFDSKLELGLGMLVQTSDRPKAEVALKKIESALGKVSNGLFKVTQRTVKDQKLTSWEFPHWDSKVKSPVSTLAYQWSTPDTLTIFSGAEASLNLLPKPWQTLDQSPNFKAAIAPLPTENMGYSYLNPPAILSLANRFGFSSWFKTPDAPEDPEMDLSKIINSVFSVAGTGTIQERVITSDGFTKLATRAKPTLSASDLLQRAQLKLGMDDDWAIANFNRSLALDPNQPEAYFGRASAKQTSQDYRGAVEDYDRVLAVQPKRVEALRYRSQSKNELFDYSGAIADATQGLELKPDADEKRFLYESRAKAAIAQGNYDSALKDIAQVPAEDRDSLGSMTCLASARARRSDAVQRCDEAIEAIRLKDQPSDEDQPSDATPSIPEAPVYESFIPANLLAPRCLARTVKRDPKSFQDCGKAITADPENPIVYELEGEARLVSGDRVGALRSLTKALTRYQALGDQTAIDRTQALIKQAQ